ncbi:MAG: glycosyltransferase family 39 protein [Myxococcales bacterium]|nr:glycosyltransferase family 39 protein [Myxococcales bacterium]
MSDDERAPEPEPTTAPNELSAGDATDAAPPGSKSTPTPPASAATAGERAAPGQPKRDTVARVTQALSGIALDEEEAELARERAALAAEREGARATRPAAAQKPVAADEQDAPLPGPVPEAGGRRAEMAFFDRRFLADWHVRASLLVLFVLLYFVHLGSFGLWDPWEVHYGAVGWGLIERHDWITPWWGSYWVVPGESMEGEPFFSKPILLLWMMGLGIQTFGVDHLEWGIRFGTALIGVLGVIAAYLAGSAVWSRKVGVLMAFALGTSPFYAMLSRQAQTDMPFVGNLTVALAFFMMGVFGRDRNRRADKLSWGIFAAFVLAMVIPQLHTITVGQLTWRYHPADDATLGQRAVAGWEAFICYGPTQLGIYLTLMVTFVVTQLRRAQPTRGQLHLYVFYVFVALATMGKGLLGFGVPGVIIFIYLAVTREWGLLRRVELLRGPILTIVVGMPWYGAVMSLNGGFGGAWWQRFIIHDHFKRLATGVHQIDTGSFEHFIKWLGYGLFPWGSFVPAVIARALSGEGGSSRSDADRARLFLFIWFAFTFTLFTVSSTKFHHYIFPAVPALAMLAALVLDDLHEGRIDFGAWWPMYVAALVLFVLVAFDLIADPQHLKNMFTYKYDRRWDSANWDQRVVDDAGHTISFGFRFALRALTAAFALGMLALGSPRRRTAVAGGLVILCTTGVATTVWALDVYMPTISSTWSQKGIWDTYYERCTPGTPPPGTHPLKADRYCVDSVISYKLNWRGETFYTLNEVLPVDDDAAWRYFIEQNGDRCFYAILERARISAFRSAVPADQRATVWVERDDNLKFVLMSANCREPVPEGGPQQNVDETPDEGTVSN